MSFSPKMRYPFKFINSLKPKDSSDKCREATPAKFTEEVNQTYEDRIKNQTFYLNDDVNIPIRACGILFYKKSLNNTYEFLVIYNYARKNYEDFGGKIDRRIDNSIYETAAREAEEESNGIFKKSEIIKKLYTCPSIYREMYLLFVTEIDKSFYDINVKTFGRYEHNDIKKKYPRYVQWFTLEQLMKNDKIIHRINKIKLQEILLN